MNALLIITGIIILVMMLDGYRIGFVWSVFGVVRLIIGTVLAAVTSYCVTTIIPPSLKYVIPAIFIAVIAIAMGIIGLIIRMINLVDRVPILREINRLAGLASGAVYGTLCVWIMFIVIAYFSDTSYGSVFYEMISEDELLTMLYDTNPLNVIIDKWKVIF